MLETCCDILVEAYHRNWITSRDGNISIRYHDRNHFYITPSGVRKQKMQYDMFKKIRIVKTQNDYHHEIIEQDDISGNLQPSGELPLHFGLQKELGQHLDDIRVVVHVHPTYTIAAMHAGISLQNLVKDFPELSRYTKVAPNVGDVPPISKELGDACHAALGLDERGFIKYDIVGIKGHGVVAVDSTPWRAFEHIERLEHICKIVLASGVHNRIKQWVEK
jgi:ribulose-5-phosphate 4-epimerase/fuculose-1-phosphate aldolase